MSKIYRSDQTLVLNDILHALDDIKDLLQKRESQHAAMPVRWYAPASRLKVYRKEAE